MSSLYARTQIENFITTNLPTENLIDLTGEYDNVKDLVAKAGITGRDPWLGIQYVGSEEIPVTVDSNNSQGYYREVGVVYLHVVAVSQLGVAGVIIPRAEEIRKQFRGQRLGELVILGVSTPDFNDGATLRFEGGYTAAAVRIEYRRDFALS